jgi:ABC-2 type transport system permease protein
MRNLLIILRKEFIQIFRDKVMSRMIFIFPIIQLVILANAATFEMKNLRLYILDNDNSTLSSGLISKFYGNKYFITQSGVEGQKFAEELLQKGDIDLYIELPANLEKDVFTGSETGIHITLNAIDGSKAGLAMFYSNTVITDFVSDFGLSRGLFNLVNNKRINVEYSHWFNPELNYITFMVPGILALLVSMIGLFLSSINIVREKEIGTIEQLNVTPIKKYQLLIGKLAPFWFIGMFELGFGLIIAKLLYNIPFLGSLSLLFGISAIYMTVILGIGLLISTITETQQQAMFFTWFFSVIFILLSGLFTAIENMPEWAQMITNFNPIKYYIQSLRMIMLKGSGLNDLAENIIKLILYSIAINSFAIYNYKKRV